MKISKLGLLSVIAVGALMATPAKSTADIISLNALLANASFEGGTQTNGCPVSWACTNLNVSVGTPTAGQYPEPNGLPSGKVVPDGNSAAFSPVSGSVTGNISQSIDLSYQAGNTYVLDFWLGNPLNGVFPSRIDVFFTTTNTNGSLGPVTNNLCDTTGRNATLVSGAQSANEAGAPCQFSITGPASGPAGIWQPADGDWRLYTMSFTTNINIPGNIGVLFSVFPQQSAANGALMHLDIPGPPPVPMPEPATLALFGAGLATLAAKLRARKR